MAPSLNSPGNASGEKTAFAPQELAHMQSVIDAVCGELGVKASEKARRNAVAQRVMAAYTGGRHLPLYMVDAGLTEQRG